MENTAELTSVGFRQSISFSASSLILNDDSCKSEAKADGGTCQTNLCTLLQPLCAQYFKVLPYPKNIGPLNLIMHLWEIVYTLRLLRKGKFHSCTWSNGYT